MKRYLKPVSWLAMLLLVVLPLSACTIEQPEVVVAPETVDQPAAEQPAAQIPGVGNAANVFVTASSLLDYDFENIDGEVSGEIEDLIMDLGTGNILYATLEYGGFLDIGDTELPVPLSAFTWGPAGQLVLAFDEATLDSFPDLGTDWPDLTTPTWDDEVGNFWRSIGIDPGIDYTEATDTVVRVSNMIGYDVGDVGFGVGNLDDMLVDLETSRVQYGLITYDAAVGAGIAADEWIAVPFEAFDVTAFGNQLTFRNDIDAAMLEQAPRYTRDAFLADNGQAFTELNNYWGGLGFGVAEVANQPTAGEESPAAQQQMGAVAGIADAQDFLVRAQALLDYDIINLNGENIGEIEDMLIDVETGHILFATLEYGGLLDLGDREVPIPLSAFAWGGEDQLILNVPEERLEALPDVGADWPNVTDATWNDEIVNFWSNEGVEPGFAAADSQTVMYVSNLVG